MSEGNSQIPNLPSLQTLRVFEAATRFRNYSASAEELGITHGAVSRQIKLLEHWAGEKLFQRRGKRMEPTPVALGLVTRVRAAVAMLGDLSKTKRSADKGLVVGTTQAFARLWLVPRLSRLFASHQGLVSAVQAEAGFFESGDRSVDVAIRYGQGRWSDVQYEKISGPDRVIAVASPTVANQATQNPLSFWLQAPLIESPYHDWRGWLINAGVSRNDIRPSLRASDSAIALDLCLADFGICLIRDRLAAQYISEGKLVRLHACEQLERYSYYAVWKANSRKANNIAQFKDWLAKEMTSA